MTHILQQLYNSEIAFELTALPFGGFHWKLGNAGLAEGNAGTFEEAMTEIRAAALRAYPASRFAGKARMA